MGCKGSRVRIPPSRPAKSRACSANCKPFLFCARSVPAVALPGSVRLPGSTCDRRAANARPKAARPYRCFARTSRRFGTAHSRAPSDVPGLSSGDSFRSIFRVVPFSERRFFAAPIGTAPGSSLFGLTRKRARISGSAYLSKSSVRPPLPAARRLLTIRRRIGAVHAANHANRVTKFLWFVRRSVQVGSALHVDDEHFPLRLARWLPEIPPPARALAAP